MSKLTGYELLVDILKTRKHEVVTNDGKRELRYEVQEVSPGFALWDTIPISDSEWYMLVKHFRELL